MQFQPFQPAQQWQEFGQPGLHETQSPAQQLLGSPLPHPHPSMALHRQVLVGNLFKHAKEIQRIDHGYSLRFYRSNDLEELIGTIAEYVIFECLNAPHLSFSIAEEPQAKAFWLQVRGLEREERDATSVVSRPTIQDMELSDAWTLAQP
ncbi:MAG: hypothetical protein Nkreftii_000433 [Candidatus Nitrospira kreftii]|uniref:Uncharacterized protein n=1 Tax=Candidatus Nitrospira kreftii TaxID=2652173 RepID=A0A7S8FAT1_9BACT|nr:MAG: hypothetical protein Nkreftii_000433 [Candidatus Nitrospira kreftii]